MDKQKQIIIEEMIGIIQGAVGGCATHWASLIAEELYKYYQPKIPENAVVLTREEYQMLNYFNHRGEELLKQERKETVEKFKVLLKGTVPQWLLDEIAKEFKEGE